MRFNSFINFTILRVTLFACACVVALICPNAFALTSQNAPQNDAVRDRWVATLDAKLFTVAFHQVPIVQALSTIAQKTGVPIQILLQDQPVGSAGIDPAITIDLERKEATARTILELVVRQASDARKVSVVGKQPLVELKLVQSRACFERARWSVAHTPSRILVSRRKTFKRHHCKVAAIRVAVQAEVQAAQQVHHLLPRKTRLAIKK